MYTSVNLFISDWKKESEATLKLFNELTDNSLGQKVWAEGRTLGFVAWHITLSIGEMMTKMGLNPDCPPEDEKMPASAAEIISTYEKAALSLTEEISTKLKDEILSEEISAYGQNWKKGIMFSMIINHQIHHRGQMTVLMRQAGIKIPGVYGPAKEDWAKFGMETAE